MDSFLKVVGYGFRIIGGVLVAAGVAVVLLGRIGVYMEHGWVGLQELLSPHNVWGYAVSAIPIVPELVLILIGEKLISRRAGPTDSRPSKRQPLWHWDAIVGSYADLLAKPVSTHRMVRDVSELPYPRAIIREAILYQLNVEQNPHLRNAMKRAYVALASFQPLTPEERRAIDVWSDTVSRERSLEDVKTRAERMQAVASTCSAVLERFESDMKIFAADMAKSP